MVGTELDIERLPDIEKQIAEESRKMAGEVPRYIPPQPEQPKPEEKKPAPKPVNKLKTAIPIAIAVLVVVVFAAVFVATRGSSTATTTIISSNTTITYTGGQFSPVTSCGKIAKPGMYKVGSNITTNESVKGGACLNVTASDVLISCGGNMVKGSGPYSGVGPFSYGIMVSNTKNVSVKSCLVRNFSYGVYSYNVTGLAVINNNVSSNYMTNVYLNRTSFSNVSSNLMQRSTSKQGSLFIGPGSSHNVVFNNTVLYSAYYGVFVNSTNNTIVKNYISGAVVSSFVCSLDSSFPKSNTGQYNICENDTGCSFLSCSKINVPANITKIQLATSPIRSCGSIVAPGTYSLSGDLNTADFVNSTLQFEQTLPVPCITIKSSYVTLNCDGHTISNATAAVSAENVKNVSVRGCSVKRSNYGIIFTNVTGSSITNSSLVDNDASIYLIESGSISVFNALASGGVYGMLMVGTDGSTITKLNSSFNNYGAYLTGSLTNVFVNSKMSNNTLVDVYASQDSANASYNLMESTSCGVTNTEWATCTNHLTQSLSYSPVNSCTTITHSGKYLLMNGLENVQSTCIQINSDNVQFSCGYHMIATSKGSNGNLIYVNSHNNVTIKNCSLSGSGVGVGVYNSTKVYLYNLNVNNTYNGVLLSNDLVGNLTSSVINNSVSSALSLINTSRFTARYNKVAYGGSNSAGILLSNSTMNTAANNTATRFSDGISFAGRSVNNTVSNNTASSSSAFDYVCSPQSGGIGAETGGINFGVTKSGCKSLAVVQSFSPSAPCTAVLTTGLQSLGSDYEYGIGATCFSVFSNSTTINCNGHTVIATNGGAFAAFQNTIGGVVENCNLRGFSSAVKSINSSVSVINNTVLVQSQQQPNSAINFTRSRNIKLSNNNVATPYHGVYISNTVGGTLTNNNVTATVSAYELYNGSSLSVQGNIAGKGSGIGLTLSNSTADLFSNNNFNGNVAGIACYGTSAGKGGATDTGQNACSSALQCAWLSQSASTC
ncbi:MAG: right-handed parallel beta-helix repeat-containing protein [Candidatus Micrarchaeota archaeon]|nr:right-handed parallel beta-helix repeat-containing protein [Candidatus Micrarchaeota archaeon]